MSFRTDESWTPARYRAAHAAWAANAPANDNDVLPRKARHVADKPLAASFAGLLAYRALTAGETALATAWTLDPAPFKGDYAAPSATERTIEIWHSQETILQEFADALRPRVVSQAGAIFERHDIDIEWGDDHYVHNRKGGEPLSGGMPIRVGRLRFSNGRQEEPCMIRNGVGAIVEGAETVPRGGLLDTGERFSKPKGEADAAGNLPPTTATRAAPAARTIEDDIGDRQEREQILGELSPVDAKILEAAMTARNFGDIGRALGHSGQYAAKAGKRLLQAANDNFIEIKKKYAA